MTFLGIVTFALMMFVSYLIFKVFRLVRFSDLPLLLSVLSIFLSLSYDDNNYIKSSDIARIIDFGKIYFFFSAIVFDVYKWVLFVLATKTYVSMKEDLYQRDKRILLISMIISQFVVLATSLGIIIAMFIDPGNTNAHETQYVFTSVVYFITLVVYITVCYQLANRLKRFYPNFYEKEKNRTKLSESQDNNNWYFPLHQLFVIILGSLFPIGSITYSLMNGINNKKKVRMRDEIRGMEQQRRSTFSTLLDEDSDDSPNKKALEQQFNTTNNNRQTATALLMQKISFYSNSKKLNTGSNKNAGNSQGMGIAKSRYSENLGDTYTTHSLNSDNLSDPM
ncbi:UNKNOWN [Stylonychia lemnae]|uniref:Uncharacterized protein n=1 Tax=Stylonychia lemnae TaxID=5949 RepID=A0A078B4X3_STYLE|nr:UNKNOWN [Stylonychia lemnae]|eukprot:CDW88277.1 UNKNOWN [Stylonychia lemnae]